MEIIRFDSVLKPKGKEFEKICIWNRFFRTKVELILTLLPAIASIVLMFFYLDIYVGVVYAVFIAYPVFIFSQFKSDIHYKLKHRDASEDAPCVITFMENGILAEVHELNFIEQYSWLDFTTIYEKFGYYMMYNKNKLVVMVKKDDIPEHLRDAAREYINSHIDHNKCVFKR